MVIALDPVPTAYSLYCTAKLNDAQAARFPELLPLVELKTEIQGYTEPEKTVFPAPS